MEVMKTLTVGDIRFDIVDDSAVSTKAQTLTETQKAQARLNIGITGTGKDGRDGINGKDGIDGINGRDGKDGEPGRDGIDGKDGEPGRDGIDGKDGEPGKDGADGYSPVRGEDYWTEEDKQEVVNEAASIVGANFVPVTQEEYESIVEAGTEDENKYYMIVGDSE